MLQSIEAPLDELPVAGRHVGASPLPALDHMTGDEIIQHLADRADADAELLRHRNLARQLVSWTQLVISQAAIDFIPKLLMKRLSRENRFPQWHAVFLHFP